MLYILSQDGKRLFPVTDLHILSVSDTKVTYASEPVIPLYNIPIFKDAKYNYLITSTGLGTLGVYDTKETRDKVFYDIINWLDNNGTYMPYPDSRLDIIIQNKVFRMPPKEEIKND